jgi:hypothetical protein
MLKDTHANEKHNKKSGASFATNDGLFVFDNNAIMSPMTGTIYPKCPM